MCQRGDSDLKRSMLPLSSHSADRQLSRLFNRSNDFIPLSLPENPDVWCRLASRMDEIYTEVGLTIEVVEIYTEVDLTIEEVEKHRLPRPG